MATIPIKSLFGKLIGLTHASSVYPVERLVVPGGIITQALYMSTAAGSETALNIQGASDVQNSSTGTAALNNYGITVLAAGASTLYTLAAPSGGGVRKTLCTASTSTAVRQVTSAVSIVVGNSSSSIGSDGSVISGSTSMTLMTFYQIGQAIELVSLSTAAWLNTSLRGFTSTNSVPFSS